MGLPKGNQIAAARALLGWDQRDVAERVGLTIAAISKIEKGENKGKTSTLEKIQTVIELAGVEFTDGEGVRKRQQHVKIFQGQQDFWSFFDDVYDVAKNHPNPDICITNVKEAEFDRWLADYEPVHSKRMTELRSHKLRVLLKENDVHVTSSSYCQYKWTKASQFADASLYIYGDKTAFIQFTDNDVLVTLVESATVTNSMRKMFEAVWDNATVLRGEHA